LRGGSHGPNYSKDQVQSVLEKLKEQGIHQGLMVDCSHGNSNKNHQNQLLVAENLVPFSFSFFFLILVFC